MGHQQRPLCGHAHEAPVAELLPLLPLLCWDRAGHPLWTWHLQFIEGGRNRGLELVRSKAQDFMQKDKKQVFQMAMNP